MIKELKIYFTSDLHGYIYPTDYIEKSEKNIGLLNIINQFDKDGNTLIIDGGDTIHLIDQIRDDSITDEKWSVKLMLEEGFKRLGKREKRIIHDRYFMGKTQMEIAAEIGISQAQVSRLEKNALQIMEEMMKS